MMSSTKLRSTLIGPSTAHRCATSLAAAIVLVAVAGCGSDAAGPEDEVPLSSLTVTTTTTGESFDADGYSVTVADRTQPVGVNASVGFEDLEPGSYDVSIDGVAANCAVVGDAVRPVTVGASGANGASVSFAIECGFDRAGTTLTPVTCTGLSPATVSGMPLDEVGLGVLPSVLQEPVLARVVAADGTEATLAPIEDDSVGVRLIVPLHPGGSADGGDVLIRISGEERTCEPFAFTIEPLPRAPGEFTAIVDLMQATIARQAELAGTTVDALRTADVASLSPVLYPMAIAQSVIDRADNPNSLRAIAMGTAPVAAEADAALLDGLMARTGFRAALESSLAAADPVAGPMSSAPAIDAVECAAMTITLPADLDACMTIAAAAAFRMEGVSDKVLSDIGMAFGVAGAIPSPGGKLVATAVGMAAWALQKVREGTANLLPSSFVSITLEASPLEFDEDREGPGDWIAEVVATSKGWAMDKLVLEAVFQMVGARGAYESWLTRFVDPSVLADLGGLVLNTFVQEMINTTGGSGIVRTEPELTGVVDVSDVAWSQSRISQGTSIVLTDHDVYEPREPGVSHLTVRTRDGMFGGRQIAADPIPIEVLEIDLDYAYNGANVERLVVDSASKAYVLRVEVDNSRYPEQVELDPPTIGSATLSYDGADAGTHTLTYTTPANLDALPALVTVRHTAATGARASPAEPRVATLEIVRGGITILPEFECLEPGESLAFMAEVTGVTNTSVTWRASAGSISDEGIYTAPEDAAPGSIDTITVASVERPDFEAEAVVRIGCGCSWSVTVDGVRADAGSGDMGVFTLSAYTGEPIIRLITLHDIDMDRSVSIWVADSITEPGEYGVGTLTGSIAVRASDLLYSSFESWVDHPLGPAITSLTIVELETARLVSGSVTGHVIMTAQSYAERRTPFSAEFQIVIPDDYVVPLPGLYGTQYACTAE